ncbi:hypothetical protein QA612_17535 [Evansella sp. AB-P1]|nr:hypothetical protein [Evansella sp. AB-P1]MDG5789265.1 hypothetical protein [Evansella sp. AB-P1]
MIGLILAIIIFNTIAFKTNKRLTGNQILHIWMFTIALIQTFDIIVDYKYHGYWYFTKNIDWAGLLPNTLLIAPVNMMFLNWYPLKQPITKHIQYITIWVLAILIYELIALLPHPWGYFHYGWWKFTYSILFDPILFLTILGYYKFVQKLETQPQ